MAVVVMTCPHCGAEKMTFVVRAVTLHEPPKRYAVLAICNSCQQPVLQDYQSRYNSRDLEAHAGDIGKLDGTFLLQTWPAPQPVDAPASVPERVARAYVDALKARRAQLWNPACGAYRRCMELALKEFAPDVEAWKLEKRIDKLAAEHRITPDIQKWAHELRLDGNEALHGDEDATQDTTDQMHHLTYFLLTYLYTLPRQVEAARERREEGEAA